MKVDDRRTAPSLRPGALACLCFVLLQFLVPLHLALNEHLVFGEAGHGTRAAAEGRLHGDHGTHGHVHGHPPSQRAHPGDDHAPHPVEDHLAPFCDPAVLPSGPYPAIALARAPASSLTPPLEPLSRRQHGCEPRGPRPPPPRATAAPRAPPIVT